MMMQYEMKSLDGCSNESLRGTKVKALTSIVYALTYDEGFDYGTSINLVELSLGNAKHRLEINNENDVLTLTIINGTNQTKWLIKEIQRLLHHINRWSRPVDKLLLHIINKV